MEVFGTIWPPKWEVLSTTSSTGTSFRISMPCDVYINKIGTFIFPQLTLLPNPRNPMLCDAFQWARQPPIVPLPWGHLHLHLIYSSLDPPHSASEVASLLLQLFLHSSWHISQRATISPSKLPLCVAIPGPLSNTWFLCSTRVYNPNGISIGSAIFAGLIKPRLHDTTCCQTGLTTGCIVYTNIQPVVKPVWLPVWQPAVSCIQPVVKPVVQPVERTVAVRSTRLSNQIDNRLYHVNGVLVWQTDRQTEHAIPPVTIGHI